MACVGGGSNSMGIFDAFVDDRGVRLVGVEAGGRAHHARRSRGAIRRRRAGRAARHAQPGAAGRRRQHPADALGVGRPRLSVDRSRARVAGGDAAGPSTPGSTTGMRSTGSSGWRGTRASCRRSSRRTRSPGSKQVLPSLAAGHGRARQPLRARRQGRRDGPAPARRAGRRGMSRLERAFARSSGDGWRRTRTTDRTQDRTHGPRRTQAGLGTAASSTLRHGRRSGSRARSADIVRALARAGADVIEVGVPFSDPIADGPAIQRASERALAAGRHLSASPRSRRGRAARLPTCPSCCSRT